MSGILLLGRDDVIESRARGHKVPLEHGSSPALPFDKTLITSPGIRVPWDLLPVAWGLLDHWDAAVPLWRYDITAEGLGTTNERQATQAIIRDLRVLLHSYELLFVRCNEAGRALVETWVQEYAEGGEKRLALLRALYIVKPRACVLPTSWLANIRTDSAQTVARGRVRSAATRNTGRPLVKVEVAPGRYVKCRPGDEQKVLEQFRRQVVRK